MTNNKGILKKILLWLWQFPQHLLAGIIYCCLHYLKRVDKVYINNGDNTVILTTAAGWSVSLGRYIFLDKGFRGPEDIDHERGHSKQSLYTGPLYLILIGIPSAVFNNLWDRLFHKSWPPEKRTGWYYNRYPEKQADRLGGVIRGA